LQPVAIFFFRPLTVEKFTLKNARLDIGFMALLKEMYEISLPGLKTGSLLPLVENRKLMRLDLTEYAAWGLYCKRPKRLTLERERYYEGIRKKKMEEYIRWNGERIEGMRTG
jgi:hypothetical protein